MKKNKKGAVTINVKSVVFLCNAGLNSTRQLSLLLAVDGTISFNEASELSGLSLGGIDKECRRSKFFTRVAIYEPCGYNNKIRRRGIKLSKPGQKLLDKIKTIK